MSSGSRAWIVAATVGTVEALKDQGFTRWNYASRIIQQRAAKSNRKPYSQATRMSSSSSALASAKMTTEQKLKKSEESLRTVMYLSYSGLAELMMSGKSRACKFEATLKMMQRPKEMSAAESVNVKSSETRRDGTAGGEFPAKRSAGDDEKYDHRKRSLERAEDLFHLIYWGPH
nr:Wound-responsive family protein [Ipomoea batatas]